MVCFLIFPVFELCIILTILSGSNFLNVSDIGGCLILYIFHFSSVVNVNLNFTLKVSEFELWLIVLDLENRGGNMENRICSISFSDVFYKLCTIFFPTFPYQIFHVYEHF